MVLEKKKYLETNMVFIKTTGYNIQAAYVSLRLYGIG